MACTSLPVINNGYITASDTERVEYECLAGFKLIGSKVIECDNVNGWASAPSCEVIKNDLSFTDASNEVYSFAPDWWYVFLSVMLCIFLVLCVIAFIWCCLCRNWTGATIHPVNARRNNNTDVENADHERQQKTWKYMQDKEDDLDASFKKSNLNDVLTPVESNQVAPNATSTAYILGYPTTTKQKPSTDTEQNDLTFVNSKYNTESDAIANKSPTASQKILQRTNAQFLASNDKADYPNQFPSSRGEISDTDKYTNGSDESRCLNPSASETLNSPTYTDRRKQIDDTSILSSRPEQQREIPPKKTDTSLQNRPRWGPHTNTRK